VIKNGYQRQLGWEIGAFLSKQISSFWASFRKSKLGAAATFDYHPFLAPISKKKEIYSHFAD